MLCIVDMWQLTVHEHLPDKVMAPVGACQALILTCSQTFALQVVSMAADSVIKVWDLRNHRCIQTIADLDWPSPEDAHPSAMMYDPSRWDLCIGS